MFGLKGYLYAGAVLGIVSLAGYGYAMQGLYAKEKAENGRLATELRVMEEVSALNEIARDVARAETVRIKREFEERYKPLVEDVLRSETDEIPAPASSVDVLNRLRWN